MNDSELSPAVARALAYVRQHCPEAQSVVLFGGALRPDFQPRWGDVDLVVVLPEAVWERVRASPAPELVSPTLDDGLQLELFLATPDHMRVSPLFFLRNGSPYTALKLIQYQVKYTSKVIHGLDLLDTIPPVEFQCALNEVVEKIRTTLPAISEAANQLPPNEFAQTHLTSLLVYARTWFALRHETLPSKLEALNEMAIEFPDLRGLLDALGSLYRKETAQDVKSKDALRFLSIMGKEICRELTPENQ